MADNRPGIAQPSNKEITFPQDSVAFVSINEIMKDPSAVPASQGGTTMEERGGVSQMSNMTAMNQTSGVTTTPSA
jgi:hypothetical protein